MTGHLRHQVARSVITAVAGTALAAIAALTAVGMLSAFGVIGRFIGWP